MPPAAVDLLPNWLGALAVAASTVQRRATADAAPDSRVAALLTLREFPGTAVGELAGIVELSHSAVVRVVDGLVAGGLVRRCRASADGRRVALVLTDGGRRTAERLQHARLDALDGLLEPLTRSQRAQLAHLIDSVLRGNVRDRRSARSTCRYCAHHACAGPACPVGSSVAPHDPLPEAR